MRVQTATRLALGGATGFAVGVLGWGMLSGASVGVYGMAFGGLVGMCYGIGLVALLAVSEGAPLGTLLVLAALAPLASGGGALLGLSDLVWLPPLLALVPLVALARRRDARTALPLDLFTAAVVVYGVLALASANPTTAPDYLRAIAGSVMPLELYFAGVLAQNTAPPGEAAPGSSPSTSDGKPARPTLRSTRAFPAAIFAITASAAGQAVLAIVLFLVGGASSLPAQGTLPDPSSLAHLLGLALVLALTWDSPRTLWRFMLGTPRRQPLARPQWTQGLPARVAAALCVTGALVIDFYALTLTASRWTLLAATVALLWAAWLRRRVGILPLLGLLALPFGVFLLTVPHSLFVLPSQVSLPSSPFALPSAYHLGDSLVKGWNAAVHVSPFAHVLAGLGAPASLALCSLFAIALAHVWRSYRRVRAMSDEAGQLLATGGALLFVLCLGISANPFVEPATGMMLWLLLGLVHGTTAALEREQRVRIDPSGARVLSGAAPARQGLPLRVAFLADGSARPEDANGLLDLFDALDRQYVLPLLISFGDGPLARSAPAHQVRVRLAERSTPLGLRTGTGRRARLLAARFGLARSVEAVTLAEHLVRASAWLTDEAAILRAVLELRPDLIVSEAPLLHVPALLAGRIAGVPVQWHAREIAPTRVQPVLDALVSWTTGVVADSEAVARSFPSPLQRAGLQIVRPGVVHTPLPTPEQVREVRAEFGLAATTPLIVCLGEVTVGSGHADLLDAVAALLPRVPALRVLLVMEHVTAPAEEQSHLIGGEPVRRARLRQNIALRGLEHVVTLLGERADARTILAAADVAVFPRRSGSEGRSALLAMDAAVPVIATKVGATAEELGDAWGQACIAPADPHALAETLAACLADRATQRTAALRHPGLVRDWFSATHEAEQLQALYLSICKTAQTSTTARWWQTVLARPWVQRVLRQSTSSPQPSAWLARLREGVGGE